MLYSFLAFSLTATYSSSPSSSSSSYYYYSSSSSSSCSLPSLLSIMLVQDSLSIAVQQVTHIDVGTPSFKFDYKNYSLTP